MLSMIFLVSNKSFENMNYDHYLEMDKGNIKSFIFGDQCYQYNGIF